MHWIACAALGAAFALGGSPLRAQSFGSPVPPGIGGHNGLPGTQPALPEVKGGVSWDDLAKVTPTRSGNRVVPQFDRAVLNLNGRDVRIAGFMMPLSAAPQQSHFLLTVTPQTCSFCIPAGPEGMIEVQTKTPVRTTFEPVVLSGRFAVLPNDPNGLYYRLTDAQPSK
ncbi:MAG TPA: DUF3299 domain-containing protein [Burkholderiaceae bacterium]|nr:DUF3299 domain-containing protein [Burkholderiaceae bacterium]